MTPALHAAGGIVLACCGWLATRRAGDARLRFDRWLLLDALIPALLFSVLVALSGRPLFAGLLTLAAGCGYAYAERAKRRTLAEPIVFTDVFQAADIFRHPQLAMPFPNRMPILASVIAAAALFLALFLIETPMPDARRTATLSLAVLVISGVLLTTATVRTALAQALAKARAGSNEPAADACRFGALGSLLAYGITARAERDCRRAMNPPPRLPQGVSEAVPPRLAPVLLIQCESFFDARRLGPGIAPDLLPAFDQACRESLQHGQLAVPCWGANTVRTEFAVLSGLTEDAIGMDRFNPYHRFARAPVNALAWQLRQRGYHTVCVHPFDRRFYGRDRVMPQLGFDVFLGEEAFVGAPRINGFVCDAAIADVVETLIREHSGGVFVFVITLENHGPWSTEPLYTSTRHAPGMTLPPGQAAALERYLASLRNGDAMLAALMSRGADGRLIGFYGDHQPSLRLDGEWPHGKDSDYVIWRAGSSGGLPTADLPAHALGRHVLEVLDTQLAGNGGLSRSSSQTMRSSCSLSASSSASGAGSVAAGT